MSLANIITSNGIIKCYDVYNIGILTINNIVGLKFDDFKFIRTNRILLLLSTKCFVKVHDYSAPIESLLLIQG